MTAGTPRKISKQHVAGLLIGLVGLSGLAAWLVLREPPAAAPVSRLEQLRRAAEVDGLVTQAESRAAAGAAVEARRLIRSALQLDPAHVRARLYHAMFLHEDGETAQATSLLAEIPDSAGPSGATARYLEGRILLDQHLARQAEARFQKSLQINPRYAAPYKELARLYALQLRPRETVATLQRLRQLRSLTVEQQATWLLAGRPVVDADQARPLLDSWLQADPQDHASLAALVKYDLDAQDTAAAARRLSAVPGPTGRLPQEPELAGLLGMVRLRQGDLSGAAAALSAEPLTDDAPLVLWDLRGRLAQTLQDWTTARAVYGYLSVLLPCDISLQHALATALERLDGHAAAAEVHQRTGQLDRLERLAYAMLQPQASVPELAVPVMQEISRILQQLQQPAQAADWLEHALQLDPQNVALRSQLAGLRQQQAGQPQLAAAVPAPQVPALRADDVLAAQPTVKPPAETGSGAVAGAGSAGATASIALPDVAAARGLTFQYFNGSSPDKRIIETVGGGAGILDVDADGWPDVYFPQGAAHPQTPNPAAWQDQVFRNIRGQAFRDCTAATGIDEPAHSLSCAVGDFDNDGFADVLVTNVGVCTLLQNQGDGTFRNVTPAAMAQQQGSSSAAAFADLDDDGLLDLYVVNYVSDWNRICRNSQGAVATCDPREFSGGQDRLYRNAGDTDWQDVTEAAGIVRPDGKGLGIVVADLDNDQRLDVYVANDGTPNFLFRNQSTAAGLQLTETAMSSGVAVNAAGRSEAGMGIACADFDGHYGLDLFVTNFYRETNTLYLSLGAEPGLGLFEDRTRSAGLDAPSREVLGFGTQAVDLDLNGTADLVVLNGDIDDYSAVGRPYRMRPQVFRNDGTAVFTDVSAEAGPFFQQPALGRGLTRVDFDADGVPDLLAVHHDRPAALLHNQLVPAVESLQLRLISARGARDAVGALVTVEHAGRRQVFPLLSGDGFASSSERKLIIPGAGHARLSRLSVVWGSGRVTEWADVTVPRQLTLVEMPDGAVRMVETAE